MSRSRFEVSRTSARGDSHRYTFRVDVRSVRTEEGVGGGGACATTAAVFVVTHTHTHTTQQKPEAALSGRLVDAASAVSVSGLGQSAGVLCKRGKKKTTHRPQSCWHPRRREGGGGGWVCFEHACHAVCGHLGVAGCCWVFLCVERCPRFPLRRQNKEATRSTPRTAQRAHTGLFTRLKGRVEPPPPSSAPLPVKLQPRFGVLHKHAGVRHRFPTASRDFYAVVEPDCCA